MHEGELRFVQAKITARADRGVNCPLGLALKSVCAAASSQVCARATYLLLCLRKGPNLHRLCGRPNDELPCPECRTIRL